MIRQPDRHTIADPYPETIGVLALTIFVQKDFRGEAEILWWYPGKMTDTEQQRMTCSAAWLLQGVFRDVRGSQLREDRLAAKRAALFDARIVALVVHAFYRARIEAAANLEVPYQWQRL
jgi:hypothetical protein